MTTTTDIEIDLAGRSFGLAGRTGEVTTAVARALEANGARLVLDELPEILVVSYPLVPHAGDADAAPMREAGEACRAMAARGAGRIVFLLSAVAALPMRRHLDYSIGMAAALAGVRGLAMQGGPHVLVNAVGAGVVEAGGELLAGDGQMLGHAALGRAGTVADIVNAVLFLCDPLNSYTTGQILNVDGGWTVGYGRNF